METEKLYYADPFLHTFTARVLSCHPLAAKAADPAAVQAWRVVLDRTAFYPEGGGQPADHGVLGGGRVVDVHEKDGEVFHICDHPVQTGENVVGRIDWARRFDHMQQHSGEHILSGILCGEYHCDNVGFHLGSDTVTIDYNADLTWEQALEAERKANERIWANASVSIVYPSPAALAALDYRSKKELTGHVRIVTFPGADCCACCGTHVGRAGQVGLVKILSCQKFREGVRMEIVCGGRALRYLSQAYEQDRAIAQRLSVKPLDTLAAVNRLEDELSATKDRMSELEDQVFLRLAEEFAGGEDVLLFQSPMRPDAVRKLADAVGKRCSGMTAVFSGCDGHFAYALIRTDRRDISPLVKTLNTALHGRGGGRNGFAQGSVQAERADIEAFFHK